MKAKNLYWFSIASGNRRQHERLTLSKVRQDPERGFGENYYNLKESEL